MTIGRQQATRGRGIYLGELPCLYRLSTSHAHYRLAHTHPIITLYYIYKNSPLPLQPGGSSQHSISNTRPLHSGRERGTDSVGTSSSRRNDLWHSVDSGEVLSAQFTTQSSGVPTTPSGIYNCCTVAVTLFKQEVDAKGIN